MSDARDDGWRIVAEARDCHARHDTECRNMRCGCAEQWRAILAALKEAGKAVVDVEPTKEMVEDGLIGLVTRICETTPLPTAEDGEILDDEKAAARYMAIGSRLRDGEDVKACWRAMIAAQEKETE